MKKLFLIGMALLLSGSINAQFNKTYSKEIINATKDILDKSFQSDSIGLSKAIDNIEQFTKKKKTAPIAYYYSAFGKWQSVIRQPSLSTGDEPSINMINSAIDDLEKATEIDADFTEAYALAANAYYALYFLEPSKIYQFAPKIAKLKNQAKKINSNNPLLVLTEAQDVFNSPKEFGGSQEKGIQLYKKAIELYKEIYDTSSTNLPKFGLELAYAWLGNGYFQKANKDLENAKKYFEKSLEIRPDFVWVKNQMLPAVLKEISEQKEVASIISDTLKIDSNNVNPDVLREGTHRYLVYFKRGKDAPRSMTSFWTRDIQRINHNGKKAIQIEQLWEQNDTIVHTTNSISDAKTMQWLYHKSWWQNRGNSEYDYNAKTGSIDSNQLSDNDTTKTRQKAWKGFKESWNQYALNWHLDLETFSILPYKESITFAIPFYDPGFSAPKYVYYTVTGSDKLIGYNGNEINCWLLEHNTPGNKEIFWVSKKTKEVLKLEQEINNGKFYRYKIKFAFSE